MSTTANFKVDPRLASILGDSYTSSEHALKELIDNSWDAEATEVRVALPTILSDDPIIVEDNGSGMKPAEVRDEYLNKTVRPHSAVEDATKVFRDVRASAMKVRRGIIGPSV